jgi:hypothetical protein
MSSGLTGKFGFASDEESTSFMDCSALKDAGVVRYEVADGAGEGAVAVDATTRCESITQLFDEQRHPVAMYSVWAEQRTEQGASYVQRAGAGRTSMAVSQTVRTSQAGYTLLGCGSVALLATSRAAVVALYDTRSGALVALPDLIPDSCPIFSADASRAAFASTSGVVRLIELATGVTTDIATSGQPIAFGASGDTVLIDGGGTFVVPTDGSKGAAASVTAAASGLGGRAYCPIGSTGAVLVHTEEGPVVFEVDSDTSYATKGSRIGLSCALSEDHRWVVSGTLLVDLEAEESWDLDAISAGDGTRVAADALSGRQLGLYSFLGPQTLNSARAAR